MPKGELAVLNSARNMCRAEETSLPGHCGVLMHRTCVFKVLLLPLVLLICTVPQTSGQSVIVSDRNVMPFEPVTYTHANVNLSYQSTVDFDARGMEHLYFITNLFLDLIQKDQVIPPGVNVSTNVDVILEQVITKWDTIVLHYIGIIVVIVVALLYIILVPLIGFVFCCCRCAGKCGARRQPFDKKNDKCKRATLTVFLSILVIIILFGVVCAFVTNEYLEQGIKKMPDEVGKSLDDTSLYLQNTDLEINSLLVMNYKELERILDSVLDRSGSIVKNSLGELSKAIAIDNLTAIVNNFDQIEDDLDVVDRDTNALKTQSNLLQRALNDRKSRLLSLLEQCSEKSCLEVLEEYKIDEELTVQTNFQELPNVTRIKNDITELMNQNIQEDVKNGQEAFNNTQKTVDDALKQNIPDIKKQIRDAGASIETSASNISDIIRNINNTLVSAKPQVQKIDGYLEKYSYYRYYVDVGLCSLLLLIFLCLVLGLLCGICGKRPGNFYGDDCCNKGTGANFLIAAVYLVFLLSFILMLIITVHFIIGALTEKIVCESLADPDQSEIREFLDDSLDIYSGEKLNIPSIVRNCHYNYSIYKVIKLDNVMNMSDVKNYKEEFGINKKIEEMKDTIRNNLDISDIEILSVDAKKKLEDFINSGVAEVNFTEYTVLLEEKITGIDLLSLVEALNNTAEQLHNVRQDALSAQLYNDALYLEALQRERVKFMVETVHRLQQSTAKLEKDLKFNKTSLKQALRDLIDQAETAENYLHTQGQEAVVQLTDTFATEFTRHIDDYITHVTEMIETDVGKCWPVSQVYNATMISICNEIIDPLNGFWASIGWCLILFIPCIFLSVCLASLYRKTDPYPGPLVETEYMYDAYADQDNIPLANVRDKKGRRSNVQSYDNHSGYMTNFSPHYRVREGQDAGGRGVYSSSVPYSTNEFDDRYRDMAPKNWDFPNGGPPQYSSNPTLANEYERPPPYYYPGPGNVKH